jgi:hypothetical protein
MGNKNRIINTRTRAIFSSIVIGCFFFFLLSPLISSVISFIFPPNPPRNIEVIEKSGEVNITWDTETLDKDIDRVIISINDIEDSVSIGNNSYIAANLENNNEYNFKIFSVDSTGRRSTPIEFSAIPSTGTNSYQYNQFDQGVYAQNTIIFTTIILSTLVFILTQWILFFRVRTIAFLTIGMYPSIVISPFILFSSSIFFTINSEVNQFIFILIVSIGLTILSYISFLTVNILHNSLRQQLPLEQAARATQFILSLISSYVVFIFALGSSYSILIKFVVILPYITYFTYSGIWILKTVSAKQIFLRTSAIVLTMVIATVVILIWPLSIVYSILSLAVIYYILLNVALDYRTTLNLGYWLEYIILIVLITVLLFTTAVWGINGTII